MARGEPLSTLSDEALLERCATELARAEQRWPVAAGAGLALAALGAWLGWASARTLVSGWSFFLFLAFGVAPATLVATGLYRLAGGKESEPGCTALAVLAALLDVGAALLLAQVSARALDAGAGMLALGLTGGGLAASQLLDRPGLAARRELRRRYREPPGALEHARRAVADEDGPDRVLLLSASALPHGGRRWVRVDLWLGGLPRGRVEARLSPFAASRDGLAGHLRGSAPLGDYEASHLVTLTSAETLESPPTLVRDGLPCELRLLRRGQPEQRAQLNVAGLSELQRREVTARLALFALELAQQAAPGQQLVGATDAQGNVRIGPA